MRVSGEVVRAADCFHDYAAYATLRTVGVDVLAIWPQGRWEVAEGFVFEADGLIVTSAFLVVDPQRGRLLIDQSYDHVETLFPMRPRFTGDGFVLETEPRAVPGRTLVIGGPIDGVWYHWLFNWAPRLLLARQLRPDLFADPATRIAVHPKALEEPFLSVLRALDVPPERCVALDPAADHRLERAAIVTFIEEARLWPPLMRGMAEAMTKGLAPKPDAGRRIYASRQALPPRRRRVANFAELEPMLRARGFEIVDTGAMTASEQVALFAGAGMVVGAHGSDLANILFCRPGTRVIVFEHDYSVHHRLHLGLQYVAETMDLDYRFLQSAPHRPDGRHPQTVQTFIDEDYVVDTGRLAALIDG